jgi:hypothetical protein
MEHLELYAKWLENEREILPLVEKLRPLLEERHRLEAEDPRLGLLRDDRTVPGEQAPPRLESSAGLLGDLRASTLMVGTRQPLVGQPDRPVPSKGDAMKQLTKAAKNRKKHLKEREKKKAKKAEEAEKGKPPSEDPMDQEERDKELKKADN